MKPINRVVSTSFWEDETIVNDFSPEDKYFYLYLITNPHTSQLGIYKLVPKTAAFELGYSKEAVMVLLERFETKYDMIRYNKETCEVAIKNYLKHSVVKGGKPVMDCLIKEESRVEDKTLLEYVYDNNIHKDNLNITVKDYLIHLSYLLNKDINDNDNENDNENERIVHESSTNRTTNRQNSKYDTVVDAWNTLVKVGINPVRSINTGSKRADCLRARVREYGEDAVLEAIEAGKEVDKILVKRDLQSELSRELFAALRGRTIPVVRVPVEKLNRITRKNHQGVIAYISAVEYAKAENLVLQTVL